MKKEVKAWTGNRTVQTRCGAVKGFEDQSNTWDWKAIPFAKPPVGNLRWKAPRDPDPWDGVREETEFSERACQNRILTDDIIGSEDCLYLNIWRPQSPERGLPVYFWIHGGGNTIQQPILKIAHGANIASQSNMVFVSINYRLGEFGWFSHPALRTGKPGDEYDDSGNYGILDIIKALEWVQDNIEAFGGNPDNVFLGGESAGAFNTLALLLSPAAKNLFHKAMSQSGGARICSVAEGDTDANAMIAHLLVNDGTATNLEEAEKYRNNMTLGEIAAYLRAKPFAEFYACRSAVPFAMSSFTDGAVILTTGSDSLEAGTYPNKVPIILGTNKEERKFSLFFQNVFPDDDELYESVAVFASDLWKASGVDGLLRRLRTNADQPDVYGYQFCWGARTPDGKSPLPEPYAYKLGASHGMDIPFFFDLNRTFGPIDKQIFTEENRRGKEALTRSMMAYVAQFIRTGDPNKPGANMTKWLPWSNEVGGPKCILFDVDGDVPAMKMTTEELAEEGVRARMEALQEPLRTKVKEAVGGGLL